VAGNAEIKAVAIAVSAIVIVACIVQALYPPDKLAQIAVRQLAALPRPLRAFYELMSFGQPYDGPFWKRARRVIAVVVGVIATAALLSALILL
jgi:hypothetical protein